MTLAAGVVLATATPSSAADIEYSKGIRCAYPTYSGFSGSVQICAWINMDYTNQQTRGYASSDTPDQNGFGSSSQARNRRDGGSFPTTTTGPRVSGAQAPVTAASDLLACFGGATFSAENLWTVLTPDDRFFQGTHRSNTSQSTCRR